MQPTLHKDANALTIKSKGLISTVSDHPKHMNSLLAVAIYHACEYNFKGSL